MSQTTIYVKASGNCIVYDKSITLGDVLKIECTNLAVLRAIKQIKLYQLMLNELIIFHYFLNLEMSCFNLLFIYISI